MQQQTVNRFIITTQEYKKLGGSQIVPIAFQLDNGTIVNAELALQDSVMVRGNGVRAATIQTTTRGNLNAARRVVARAQRTISRANVEGMLQPNRKGKFECTEKGCTAPPYDTRRSLGVHLVKAHGIHSRLWKRSQQTKSNKRGRKSAR